MYFQVAQPEKTAKLLLLLHHQQILHHQLLHQK
jgi:hypothetical protein